MPSLISESVYKVLIMIQPKGNSKYHPFYQLVFNGGNKFPSIEDYYDPFNPSIKLFLNGNL